MADVNPEQSAALGKILQQSDNLLQIMNALPDTASIETSALALRNEEFSVAAFVDELKTNYEGIIDNADRALKWEIAAPLPRVVSDQGKLPIVLQNLINNAAKFTEKGEIRVSVRYHADRKEIEFVVADTDIGIAKEQIPMIFEKFWRVHAANIKDHGGMGLGL